MISDNRRTRAHTDYPLMLMSYALALFGIIAVTIATFTTNDTADASLLQHIASSSYAVRQCIFVAIAPIITTVVMNWPYNSLKRMTPFIYFGGTILLVVVLFASQASGVKAWLDFVWGFTIQPSEIVKLSMILMVARELSRSERPMGTLRDFTRIMLMIAIPAVVILASGEMGSLLVIIFMCAVMMWFANVDLKIILGLAAAAILGIALLYSYTLFFNSDSYRLKRILAFINPAEYSSTDAYQQQQSMMVIGSGGLFGIGAFKAGAMSQLNYVPADWTDFIYATIGEAFGFVGCVAIIMVYFLIILRLLYLARNTRDKFGALVIHGVMGMLFFHVLENIGMTIGLMPITGIPLPFISYGGSNMVVNMTGIALALNVTKHRSLANTILTPQTSYGNYQYSYGPKLKRR